MIPSELSLASQRHGSALYVPSLARRSNHIEPVTRVEPARGGASKLLDGRARSPISPHPSSSSCPLLLPSDILVLLCLQGTAPFHRFPKTFPAESATLRLAQRRGLEVSKHKDFSYANSYLSSLVSRNVRGVSEASQFVSLQQSHVLLIRYFCLDHFRDPLTTQRALSTGSPAGSGSGVPSLRHPLSTRPKSKAKNQCHPMLLRIKFLAHPPASAVKAGITPASGTFPHMVATLCLFASAVDIPTRREVLCFLDSEAVQDIASYTFSGPRFPQPDQRRSITKQFNDLVTQYVSLHCLPFVHLLIHHPIQTPPSLLRMAQLLERPTKAGFAG